MTARWNSLPTRCATCNHGPTAHTGGHGQCWTHPCGCSRFVDAVEVAECIARHPAKGQGK